MFSQTVLVLQPEAATRSPGSFTLEPPVSRRRPLGLILSLGVHAALLAALVEEPADLGKQLGPPAKDDKRSGRQKIGWHRREGRF